MLILAQRNVLNILLSWPFWLDLNLKIVGWILKFKCVQDKAGPQYNESDELGLPPTGCGVTLLSRDDAAGILVLWGGGW